MAGNKENNFALFDFSPRLLFQLLLNAILVRGKLALFSFHEILFDIKHLIKLYRRNTHLVEMDYI